MDTEKVIGFSIEISGTDSQVARLGDVKRALLDATKELNQLKDATAGNIGAQKASASQMAELETRVKSLKEEYNSQQRAILNISSSMDNAVGSYDALVAENAKLSKELRALPIDETSERFKQLRSQIAANQIKILEFNDNIGRAQGHVGDYSGKIIELARGFSGVAGLAHIAAEALGVNSEAVKGLAVAHSVLRTASRDGHHVQELFNDSTVEGTAKKQASIIVTEEKIVATEAETAATVELTIAEKAWQAVKAGGIGLLAGLVVAIGAVVVAIVEYVSVSKIRQQLEDESMKTTDGLIIADKALRKEHEATILKLQEMNLAWQVYNGTITKTEEKIEILKSKHKLAAREITNTLNEELGKAKMSWTGSADEFVKAIEKARAAMKENALAMAVDIAQARQEAAIKEADENKKKTEEYNKKDAEILAKMEETRAKIAEKAKLLEDKRISDLEKYNERAEKLNAEIDLKELEAAKKLADEKEKLRQKEIKDAEKEQAEIDKIEKDADARRKHNLDERINNQSKSFDERLSLLKTELTAELITQDEYDKKSVELEKQRREAFKTISKDMEKDVISLMESITTIENNNIQKRINATNSERDAKIAALDQQLAQGIISQAQHDAKVKKLTDDAHKEEAAMKKKQWENDKRASIIKAEIATAEATLQAFNDGMKVSYYYAAALAVAAGVVGQAQVAVIESQPEPTFARGGLLNGPSHSRGGIPFSINGVGGFEAEGGEAIINKRSVEMYRPLLSAINAAGGGKKFAAGDVLTPSFAGMSVSSSGLQGHNLDSFAQRIVNGINAQRVYVTESDITNTQSRVNVIETDSSF